MTNPTLERAARAVCELHGGDYWDKAAPYERGRYRDVARAVLMAVREPTDEMDAAGFERLKSNQQNPSPEGTCSAVYTAMIDAILNDGERD